MGCLLSIVIPTRNRELYCIEAIKSILSFNRDCFELVIKDNSDSDTIEDYVSKNPDDRLKYYRTRGRVNSVINMADAVSYAKGDYVCMIGDDDAVLPNIFSVAKWAKENNVKAVTPRLSYGFLWDHNNNLRGQLIAHGSTPKTKRLESKKQLSELLKNGIIQYDRYDLPRMYHGLFRRDVLNAIYNKTGHYIGGLSPDIYLSVSSCFYVEEYYKVDFPFTIPGNCVQSTSVGNPRGSFKEMPHLWHRGDYKWHELIPKYNSAQTIWAETALKAIEENTDNLKWIGLFNKKYFLTVFWLQNRDRHKEIKQLLGNKSYVDYLCAVKYYLDRILIKSRALINLSIGERKTYSNLESWPDVIERIKNQVVFF